MSNKIIKETINYIFSGEYSPENKNGARKKKKGFTKKKERFYKKKERFYKKKRKVLQEERNTQNKIRVNNYEKRKFINPQLYRI